MISKETLSSHSLGTSSERSPTKGGHTIVKPIAAEIIPSSPNKSTSVSQNKKTTLGDVTSKKAPAKIESGVENQSKAPGAQGAQAASREREE